jgi:hypothetical protein
MFWFIALLLFFLLHGWPASAHQPILLDARQATPGLAIEMHRLPEPGDSTEAKYRFRSFGFPRGVNLLLWEKEFDHSFYQMASVFQVDRSGGVVEANSSLGKRPRKLDEMTFMPGPYPRGALWEVALVSSDRKLQAFAKAIPYPIIARNSLCVVSLELVSHRGEKFLASGSGFIPGDEVATELRYASRVIDKRVRTSVEGLLPPQVILHAAIANEPDAHYTVKGRFCEVSVDYQWGKAALIRR